MEDVPVIEQGSSEIHVSVNGVLVNVHNIGPRVEREAQGFLSFTQLNISVLELGWVDIIEESHEIAHMLSRKGVAHHKMGLVCCLYGSLEA